MMRRPTPFNITAFIAVYALVQIGLIAIVMVATGTDIEAVFTP